MPDVHDAPTRSRNMAAIRATNTRPELLIRRGLHRRGYRYRLKQAQLPGRPDIVFRRFRAIIFVHGCFWHGHDCELFRLPQTRTEFWESKIAGTRGRDLEVQAKLKAEGWRQAVVWECAIRGRHNWDFDRLFDELSSWLEGSNRNLEIAGLKLDRPNNA